MESLNRVIKQKCKYLPVKYYIEDEDYIRYYLHNRGNHIPNWIPIYKTPHGIISENSVTLLNEITPPPLFILKKLFKATFLYLNHTYG